MNSLPNDNNLDESNFKEFSEDKINLTKIIKHALHKKKKKKWDIVGN